MALFWVGVNTVAITTRLSKLANQAAIKPGGFQIERTFDEARLAEPPLRQVRALFDESTITVYQAYSVEIAAAAVAAQNFVQPFRLDRMTWIKPSFTWMMYRSNWAKQQGQEKVLAIRMSRKSFDQMLENSCLSSFDKGLHRTHDAWRAQMESCHSIVQWDPERSLRLERLPWRSIQIGLMRSTAQDYATSWDKEITDITDVVQEIHKLLTAGKFDVAERYRPSESPYPLTVGALHATGAND